MKFTISADYINDKARELVLSGQWRSAMDFLKDSMNDIDYDTILSILKGEKKLQGNNEFELVEEEELIKKEYELAVESYYNAGKLCYNQQRYSAYGIVETVTQEEGNKALSSILYKTNKYDQWKQEVSRYYMKNETDESFLLFSEKKGQVVCVLFQQDNTLYDPPFWIELPANPIKSVNLLEEIEILKHNKTSSMVINIEDEKVTNQFEKQLINKIPQNEKMYHPKKYNE